MDTRESLEIRNKTVKAERYSKRAKQQTSYKWKWDMKQHRESRNHCCTHSCVDRAVGVTRVCGLMVVMWVLLMAGQVVRQACMGEGRTTPGPLTTTATSGPIGAKAWTHGCCLTAVVPSHCYTGLEGGMERGMERWNRRLGKKGKERCKGWVRGKRSKKRKCEGVQWQMLPSRTSLA